MDISLVLGKNQPERFCPFVEFEQVLINYVETQISALNSG
jgi:hypothetical protein